MGYDHDLTNDELNELNDTQPLEDTPEGFVCPKWERNREGRFVKGHSGAKKPKPKPLTIAQQEKVAKQLRISHQQETFLTHAEEVALKRETIQSAVTESMMRAAISDLYKAAMECENPYAKKALWSEFFLQVVGAPPKQLEIREQTYTYKQSVDYSNLTQDELKVLESIAGKVVEVPATEIQQGN
jgi:hypothetical protein